MHNEEAEVEEVEDVEEEEEEQEEEEGANGRAVFIYALWKRSLSLTICIMMA